MAKKKSKPAGPPTVENRRARFDYHILDTLEVGVVLHGSEVKSVREGKVSLAEGYVRVQERPLGLFLHGASIAHYGPAGPLQHRLDRPRPLLAHAREIRALLRQVAVKGMTIVPLRLYFKNGYAKILIGVARGKTAHDKRSTIADRDAQRDIARALSKRQ